MALETIDSTKLRSETSSCVVCRCSKDAVVDRHHYRLPVSGTFVKTRLSSWESSRVPPRTHRFATRVEETNSFHLCESCLDLVKEIDRLEVELHQRFLSLWHLVDDSSADLSRSAIKKETEEPGFLQASSDDGVRATNVEEKREFDPLSVCFPILPIEPSEQSDARRTKRRKLRESSSGDHVESQELDDELCGETYDCDKCDRKFDSSGALRRHSTRAHPAVHPTCPVCGDVVESETLRRHLASKHKDHDEFKCEHCDLVFDKYDSLKTHVKDEHAGVQSYVCDECGKSFTTSAGLAQHRHCHTTTVCPICGKMIRGKPKVAIAMHISVVHEAKKMTCDICGKQFSGRGFTTLAKHKFKVHQIETRSHRFQHPCPTCGKMCATKGTLTNHLFSKHGIVPEGKQIFPCTDCDKTFATRILLETHLQLHSGTKRHACPDCDYRATQFCTLKTHMKYRHKRDVKRVFLSKVKDGDYMIVDANASDEAVAELLRDKNPVTIP